MIIHISQTTQEMAEKAALSVAEYIRDHPDALICFAAGDTPLQMLAQLVALQEQGEVDLRSVYYVGLDEWCGIGRETSGSCAQVMRDHFYTPAGIPSERMCIWDGRAQDLQAQCHRISGWIARRGGIRLTVLGIGMNGHVGFNEPGTPWNLDCGLVDLDDVTTTVGPKYFGGAPCPTQGVTVGIARLLEAERMILMAAGSMKAPVIRRALMEKPTEAFPASCIQRHPAPRVFIDRALFTNL